MPERRAAILAGRFSVFVCHQCQGRTRIEPTMLYTDFDRWSWYGVFPQTAIRHRSALAAQVAQLFHHNIELAAAPIVKSWAPNFKRRTVFGLASLRDKLLCE